MCFCYGVLFAAVVMFVHFYDDAFSVAMMTVCVCCYDDGLCVAMMTVCVSMVTVCALLC